MRMKTFTLCLLTLIVVARVYSQELHNSYYQFTPLNVNPANAGAFAGSYRVSGIYSDKQAAITPRPFRTLTVSADAPIIKGIRKQDWVGIGVQFDVLGQSGLNFQSQDASQFPSNNPGSTQSWTFLKIGLAYHLALDKKQTNIFTLGAQFSNGNRNFSMLNSRDGRVTPQTNLPDKDIQEFNAGPPSAGQTNNSGDVIFGSSRDLSVGVLYNARRKKSDMRIGLAVEGLLNPAIGFNSRSTGGAADSVEHKYFGINLHGTYDMEVSKKLHIVPAFYYYNLGPANALNVNSHAWYQLDPEKDLRLGAGLGVRNLRAGILYLGAEFKDIRAGFAYDMDFSSATIGSAGVGGYELAVSYMGKIYKKPKPKPVIFCPRL